MRMDSPERSYSLKTKKPGIILPLSCTSKSFIKLFNRVFIKSTGILSLSLFGWLSVCQRLPRFIKVFLNMEFIYPSNRMFWSRSGMSGILFSLLFALIIVPQCIEAQETEEDDNPYRRAQFEIFQTKDPKTGRVPKGIRLKELNFMKRQQSLPNYTEGVGDLSSPWRRRGPFNVGGRTRAMGIDVGNENVILAGGVSGGMWRSSDFGLTWSKSTGANDLQSVSCLAQDTRNGHTNTWYYGTGEWFGNSASSAGAPFRGDGLFKSEDGGVSWRLLEATSSGAPETNSPFDYNYNLTVNPLNGDLLVATIDGIYLSDDGGTSFEKVLIGTGITEWTDIVGTEDGAYYAIIDDLGLFYSQDGYYWEAVRLPDGFSRVAGERKVLALGPAGSEALWVAGENNSHATGHNLWYFDIATEQWTDLSDNIPMLEGASGNFDSQSGYDLVLKVSPFDKDLMVLGGTNLFRSTDGFRSTENTSWIGGYEATNEDYGLYPNHHPDQHAFIFLPGNRAISANDGGLQLTEDITSEFDHPEVVKWTSLNNGYLTTQVYAVSAGPDEQVMAGFQDNSTWVTFTEAAETNWDVQFSGDGGYSAFSKDGLNRYISAQRGIMRRYPLREVTDIEPITSVRFSPFGLVGRLFIVPFYIDPLDDDLGYLGGQTRFYINTRSNRGYSTIGWRNFDIGALGIISEFGVTRANMVYVGTTQGEIIRVEDPANSALATDISGSNLPTAYVSGIAVNPADPQEILISFSNYGIPSLFHTTNGGAEWIDVSGNLEENPDGSGSGPSVRHVAMLGVGERYFAATSTGLYSTTELTGANTVWVQESPDLIGDVVVNHIATKPLEGLMVVGTHGNGVYSATYETDALPVRDLAVAEIVSPDVTLPITGESTSIRATVRNNGSEEVNSFEMVYGINGEEQGRREVTNSISPFQEASFSFSEHFDFSTADTYELTVSVEMTGDEVSANNSKTRTVRSVEPVTSYPYAESFETDEHGWTVDGGLWELGTPAQTAINGAYDGDRAWMTDLNGDYPNYANARLISPIFDFTGLEQPVVSFFANYRTESDYDGFRLMVRIDLDNSFIRLSDSYGTNNWYTNDDIDALNGPGWDGSSSGQYLLSEAQLDFLANQPQVQFAIEFKSDVSYIFPGVAIDLFQVSDRKNDIGFTAINSPSNLVSTSGELSQVSVNVKNFSESTVENIQLEYLVDGTSIGTQTIASMEAGQEIDVIFEDGYDFSEEGAYQLTVTAVVEEDGNISNNSLTREILSLTPITEYPYAESFETVDHLWTTDGDGWELGEPAGTQISAASDGEQAWVTNLEGEHNANQTAVLMSPLFDFSQLQRPVVSFDLNYITESEIDGAYLAYRTDLGSEFQRVALSSGRENWYNSNFVLALGSEAGWTGSTEGNYQRAIGRLDDLAGEPSVQLALIFSSDRSIQNEGIAMDAFRLEEIDTDLSIISIDTPNEAFISSTGNDQDIKVTIANPGGTAQSGFSISYTVNGQLIASQSIAESLESGDELEFTFDQVFDFSEPGAYDLKVEVSADGDQRTQNDTLQIALFSYEYVTNFPYASGFETEQITWKGEGVWKRGTPDKQNLTGAREGENTWVTELVTDYEVAAEGLLESPIFNFDDMRFPVLSFWLNYHMVSDLDDGVTLLYRTALDRDYVPVEERIGLSSWYTDPKVDALGNTAGWNGRNNEYTLALADFAGLADRSFVQFAFSFASGSGPLTDEGMALDELSIYEAYQPTLISLSENEVDENQTEKTLIGEIQLNQPLTDDYEIQVTGLYEDLFEVTGTELFAIAPLDFETKNSYEVNLAVVHNTGEVEIDLVTISVRDGNDKPFLVTTPADTEAIEDIITTIYLPNTIFNDPEGEELAISFPNVPEWLEYNEGGNTLSGTPLQAHVGQNVVTVRATDPHGLFLDVAFDVNVDEVDDPPYLYRPLDTLRLVEDVYFEFDVPDSTFVDEEGEFLDISVSTVPWNIGYSPQDDQFWGTPRQRNVGAESIQVYAEDPAGQRVIDTLTFLVENVNDAPVELNVVADTTILEDSFYDFSIPDTTFMDEDGDDIMFSISNLPDFLTFDQADTSISGTPLHENIGEHIVRIEATDPFGETGYSEFKITVANTNDPPTIVTELEDIEAPINELITIPVPPSYATDIDGDEITVVAEKLPNGFFFFQNEISGVATQAIVGENEVIMAYEDGQGGRTLDTFIMTVDDVVVSLDEERDYGHVSTQPNPFTDRIIINIEKGLYGKTTFLLKSADGQESNKLEQEMHGERTVTWKLNKLPANGLYLLIVQSEGKPPIVRKILKR